MVEMTDLAEEQQVFNDIQFNQLLLEPAKSVEVNRNIALGNITEKAHRIAVERYREAELLLGFPEADGGWFTKEIGKGIMSIIHFDFISSGSLDGFNRRQFNTRTINRNEGKSQENKLKQYLVNSRR